MEQQDQTGRSEMPGPQASGRAPGLGLSAIELAAKRGIGPLSLLAAEAWHGQARPCPSCGQLIRRTASVCDQCGQDLSPHMLLKMQAHSGPWYVLEHIRPFPGVTLERLILQARRGVLTATTIVRGPTTYHQWRFAAETPGLSKYLGLCCRCQASVSQDDQFCASCRANLDGETDVLFEQARPELVAPSAGGSASAPAPAAQPRPASPLAASASRPAPAADAHDELGRLSAAIGPPGALSSKKALPTPLKIAGIRVGWIVAAMVIALVLVLCWVVYMRSNNKPAPKNNREHAAQLVRCAEHTG